MPVPFPELKRMVSKTDMKITEIYGNYSYGTFDPKESDFMICKMIKNKSKECITLCRVHRKKIRLLSNF